jgi:hypothetical protein
VRFIGGADFGERSLSCIAEVPQGGLVWLMQGDADSVLSATLAASAAGVPVAGFYTYGEIARTRGTRGFHNQTLVVLSIA